MPNDISAKLTIDTSEGVANIKVLADTTEVSARRSAKAMEAIAKQAAINNRLLKDQVEEQRRANDATMGIERAVSAGKGAAAAIGEATKAAADLGHTSAGAAREMLVLFHEGVTGNFKRAAGSMIVLAERTGGAVGAMQAVFSALASPAAAAAAAVVAFGVAAEQGYKSSEDFRRALILTGGAAGITEGQFRAMAQSIAAETGRSVGSAKDALQSLAASGQVAPQNLAKMGTAIVQIAHLLHESSAEVAKQFDDMATDVVGWINRHKQYFDSLTSSQVEAIRQLQKLGDIQGAVGLALDAVNVKTVDSAGFWERLGNAASGAWEKISHRIGGANTPEDTLKALDSQIASIEARLARVKAHPEQGSVYDQKDTADLPVLRQQRAAAQAQAAAGQAQAAQRGTEQATQNAGKAARAHLDAMLDEAKGAAALAEAMKKLHAEEDAAARAGTPYSDAEKRDLEAKVLKAHRDPNDKKEETAYASTLKSMTDEKAKLDAITQSYTKYGHAVDESREAVIRARTAAGGDLASASAPQRATLVAAAAATDHSSNAAKEAEHLASVEKQVKAYADLSAAKEADGRAGYIEQQLGAHGLAISEQTTDALKKQGAVLAQLAGQNYDRREEEANAKAMEQRQLAVDAEVEAIKRQGQALHETSLERAIATDVAKIQNRADQELNKTGADAILVQAQLHDDIARVTEARTSQYNAARDPQIAAAAAAGKWGEDASNPGAAAAKMTTNSLDDISASIEKMTKTGKLNFADLWKTMADQFLSNIIRMEVGKVATGSSDLWGGLFKAISGLGGSGSASPQVDEGSTNLFAGARAAGGNVNAGGTYLIGEQGAEMFKPTGSGTIVPNHQLGGGGGSSSVSVGAGQVINVGQGVSRAEMQQAMTQANAATMKQVQRLSSTGKLRQS